MRKSKKRTKAAKQHEEETSFFYPSLNCLEKLPIDVIEHMLIQGKLDLKSLAALSRANRSMYNIIKQERVRIKFAEHNRKMLSLLSTPKGILRYLEDHIKIVDEGSAGKFQVSTLFYYDPSSEKLGLLTLSNDITPGQSVYYTRMFNCLFEESYDEEFTRVPGHDYEYEAHSYEEKANSLTSSILQLKLDSGYQFAVSVRQQEPAKSTHPDAVYGILYDHPSAQSFWFLPVHLYSRTGRQFSLYDKGAVLIDDTWKSHPFCVDYYKMKE